MITKEQLQQLCRHEITPTDLFPEEHWDEIATTIADGTYDGEIETYRITLEDLQVGLQLATEQQNTCQEILDTWLHPLVYVFYDHIDLKHAQTGYGENFVIGLPNRYDCFADIIDVLLEVLQENDGVATVGTPIDNIPDLQFCLEEIASVLEKEQIPWEEREFTDEEILAFLNYWDSRKRLARADETVRNLFVRLVDMGCERNLVEALEANAFGHYGNGNGIFQQDYTISRDCLLKLMEIANDPDYANTLGYIYYYGRCNNGEPEYEKAYYYFSIGSAAGNMESSYKLADLFYDGKGIAENKDIAQSLVSECYDYCHRNCMETAENGKLADVAWRMGKYMADRGEENERYYDIAYEYFLEARMAIQRRLAQHDYFGDESVAMRIQADIDAIHDKTSVVKNHWEPVYARIDWLLMHSLREEYMIMEYTENGEDDYTLYFRHPKKPNGSQKGLLLPVSELNLCMLTYTLEVHLKNATKFLVPNHKKAVLFDSMKESRLYLDGNVVAEIAGAFTLTGDNVNTDTVQLVDVKFSEEGRTYSYLCGRYSVKDGDQVIITTKDENTYTLIAEKVYEKRICDLPLPYERYKTIDGIVQEEEPEEIPQPEDATEWLIKEIESEEKPESEDTPQEEADKKEPSRFNLDEFLAKKSFKKRTVKATAPAPVEEPIVDSPEEMPVAESYTVEELPEEEPVEEDYSEVDSQRNESYEEDYSEEDYPEEEPYEEDYSDEDYPEEEPYEEDYSEEDYPEEEPYEEDYSEEDYPEEEPYEEDYSEEDLYNGDYTEDNYSTEEPYEEFYNEDEEEEHLSLLEKIKRIAKAKGRFHKEPAVSEQNKPFEEEEFYDAEEEMEYKEAQSDTSEDKTDLFFDDEEQNLGDTPAEPTEDADEDQFFEQLMQEAKKETPRPIHQETVMVEPTRKPKRHGYPVSEPRTIQMEYPNPEEQKQTRAAAEYYRNVTTETPSVDEDDYLQYRKQVKVKNTVAAIFEEAFPEKKEPQKKSGVSGDMAKFLRDIYNEDILDSDN